MKKLILALTVLGTTIYGGKIDTTEQENNQTSYNRYNTPLTKENEKKLTDAFIAGGTTGSALMIALLIKDKSSKPHALRTSDKILFVAGSFLYGGMFGAGIRSWLL